MKDIHIKILQCFQNNPNGLAISQIAEMLNVTPESLRWLDDEANTGSNLLSRKEKSTEYGGWTMVLGLQGRAVLLQHEEIQQAKKSSLIAITISILALVSVIIVGYLKIEQNKKSHKIEMIELKNVNSNLIKIQDSLNSTKKYQKKEISADSLVLN